MKKILLLSLLLAGTFTLFPTASALAADKPAINAAAKTDPQLQQRRRGRNWGRDRVYIQTRTVRQGRSWYRETYRVRVHNGRTTTTLISRTRINRR